MAQITWLDPGGDAVQAAGYFSPQIAAGGVDGIVSFDSTQKVVGVGSWKFDSADSTNGVVVGVSGVLGASSRISFYWRYDSVPDYSEIVIWFASGTSLNYSGGGFTNASRLVSDNNLYATATPAKNAGQGTICTFFSDIPPSAVIESVKIIYERKYDVDTSVGSSRIKTRINGIEGPNHDNTDQPLTDTVVIVDVTSERAWTPPDFANGIFAVIAEARRGDTDTAHTQSWDYVKVEIVYHSPVGILIATGLGGLGHEGLRLAVTPKGMGVVLRFVEGGIVAGEGTGYDGITQLLVNTWYRISLAFVQYAADDLDIKIYINGVEELAIVGASTASYEPLLNIEYGCIGKAGADHISWFEQIYVDDGNDLSDPGNKLTTAKLPAAVNQNNWATTGGTGAVNERPVNETNHKEHSASIGTIRQTYMLQTADAGDVDISGKTVIGYMAWAWSKSITNSGGYINLVVSGMDILEDTTGVGGPLGPAPALLHYPVTTNIYPSDADGIGMALVDLGDPMIATLFECGIVVCYEGPNDDDPLLPLQLLAQDSETPITDDLRSSPPETYELRLEVSESNAKVAVEVYAITEEGQAPQLRDTLYSGGGSVRAPISNPGIEVSCIVQVSEADAYVSLRRRLDV